MTAMTQSFTSCVCLFKSPAALGADRGQTFISDALAEWGQTMKPTSSEMGLATLVASVACREAMSLDYALKELAGGGPVKLKARQRVVFRTALAQYKYCTRMPVYAVVDNAVEVRFWLLSW